MDNGSRLRSKDLGASLLPQLLNPATPHLSTSSLLLAVRCRLSISNLLLAAHIRSRKLHRRATALRLRVTVRLLRGMGLLRTPSRSRRSAATPSRG